MPLALAFYPRKMKVGLALVLFYQVFFVFIAFSEAARGLPAVGGMNGSGAGGTVTTSLSGQQLASAIPSPNANKSWRSKSMNLKHSATSSMLASPTHTPSQSQSNPAPEGFLQHGGDGSKGLLGGGGGPQRSMLDKFRLINPRATSRSSPSVAEMALQEEDDLSECGEDGLTPAGPVCGSGSAASKQMPTKTPGSSAAASTKAASSSSSYSKASNGNRPTSKDKEEKSRSGKSKDSEPSKEERDSFADPAKKSSKIASLIPKGGKPSSAKKDGGSSASSGIPKPGLKPPSAATAKSQNQSQSQSQVALNSSGNMRGGEGPKLTKGGGQSGSFYVQRSMGGSEAKRTSMTSSTSTSALSGSTGLLGGGGGGGGGAGGAAPGGNGVVQLPQQQQHNHPNTATVAPFMYR